jgi:hypothetical protein
MAAFSIPRRNTRVNQILAQTLNLEENFFYPPDWDEEVVRICANIKEDPRKFSQIADQEIKSCMYHLLEHATRLDRKDLFLQVVKVFGFPSVQERYLTQLDRILEELAGNNQITIRGEEVKVNN